MLILSNTRTPAWFPFLVWNGGLGAAWEKEIMLFAWIGFIKPGKEAHPAAGQRRNQRLSRASHTSRSISRSAMRRERPPCRDDDALRGGQPRRCAGVGRQQPLQACRNLRSNIICTNITTRSVKPAPRPKPKHPWIAVAAGLPASAHDVRPSPDGLCLERVTGIEPVRSAWEADRLPVHHTRRRRRPVRFGRIGRQRCPPHSSPNNSGDPRVTA